MKNLSELISFEGRCALITGSASGIGKAIAFRFSEAGAKLILVDVDEEGLKRVKKELSDRGEVITHRVDLSNKKEIDALWHKLEGDEPDILVNNAGIYPIKGFLEVDEGLLGKVMDVNLNSMFWMCQHMIGARERKGGVIINVSSIEAIMPFKEDMTHYGMSKAGVLALTRSLAKDFGKRGYRVNALVPGGILTPGTVNVAKGVAKLNLGLIKTGIEFMQRLPMGRAGKPDEVALMALVLASDLSSYVNGAIVAVDGGFLSA